jgi:hypothetical protein
MPELKRFKEVQALMLEKRAGAAGACLVFEMRM